MKCPYCDKNIVSSPKEVDTLLLCPHCSMRLYSGFHIVDFINDYINLFNIFGIFTAIAVILPSFSPYSKEVVNKTTNTLFYLPPATVRLTMLDFFTSLFIIGCGITILFIFTMIMANLFGGERYREIIFWQSHNKRWKITKDDLVRYMFAIPFTLLSLSLIMYIALISGDYFQYYIFLQAIAVALILILIHRGSPHLFEGLIKRREWLFYFVKNFTNCVLPQLPKPHVPVDQRPQGLR